jgi:hypothetical protein
MLLDLVKCRSRITVQTNTGRHEKNLGTPIVLKLAGNVVKSYAYLFATYLSRYVQEITTKHLQLHLDLRSTVKVDRNMACDSSDKYSYSVNEILLRF